MAEAYIVAAARTAGGRKGGRLSGWHPADLAAEVLKALVERSKADPALIENEIAVAKDPVLRDIEVVADERLLQRQPEAAD